MYTSELLASSGEGGVGYLLKERVGDVRGFVDAVQRVADGGTALDPQVVSGLLADPQEGGRLRTLSPRERAVLELRYGLDGKPPRTLDEVGRTFNVTRERIRQIEAKALRKLRHPSRSRKLKDYLD